MNNPTPAPAEAHTPDDERCFACGRRLLRKNRYLAHVAGDEQNVYVGPECHDNIQLHRGPWQPPKGGPKLLLGWIGGDP